MSKEKSPRTRNYACVVYPESAPVNWSDILINLKVPCLISPLHDMDINPDGEHKKEHYHVIIMFDSMKTKLQAEEVFSSINGVGCEVVKSIRAYARYLVHMDNPDKYQYALKDVKAYGVDYMSIISISTDKYVAIGQMMEWVESNQCYSYATLLKYARDNNFEWFKSLADNSTLVMKEFIKSYSWSNK